MRIIAGEFRGRQILGPEGDTTRPITDRVKQSLFDILTPLLPGAVVYDCFAGTGSMGLESLSRGAEFAVFFEMDRGALARLRKNIAALGVEKRCQVVTVDLFKWFAAAPTFAEPIRTQRPAGNPVDVIFLDPPYRFLRERPGDLQALAKHMSAGHLMADGTIVFRHDAADRLDLAATQRYDERTYGQMALEFLRAAAP